MVESICERVCPGCVEWDIGTRIDSVTGKRTHDQRYVIERLK